MTKNPRFIADSKKVDYNLPAVADSSSAANINVPNIPSFDLDQLNLVELCGQLRDSLNKPSPMFIFSSERRNKKLELQRDRIKIILETIESMRDVNVSLAKARAEILLSKSVSESIIKDYFTDKILIDELKRVEHKNNITKHEDEMKARKLTLEAAELDNALKRQRIELIDFVKTHIKPDDLSPYHKGLLLQAAINPQGVQHQDLSILQELKDSYVKEAQLKNKLLEAQVTKDDSQAKISVIGAEKSHLDFENLKKRK